MAGNYITIGSKFKPFSYQEMIAPLAMATEAHQQVEQQYADLSTQASLWEGKLNPSLDKETYAKYKSYADELNNQASILAKEGLNPGSRKSMFSMRDKYAKDIVPIETAYTKRAEDDKIQRQLELTDPSRRFSRKASQTSLDKYVDNPNLEYNSVSLEQLKGQVAQAASMLSKGLSDNYDKGKVIDSFTNTFKKQHGYTKEEVQDAIDNPNKEGSSAILNDIVDTVMTGSNIDSWADQKTLDETRRYLSQGLFAAVGQTDVQVIENKAAIMAAQEAMQIRIQNAQNKQEKEQKEDEAKKIAESKKIAINTLSIVSPDKEGAKAKSKSNDAMVNLGLTKPSWIGNTLKKNHVIVPMMKYGAAYRKPDNVNGDSSFKLWTDDGRLLTPYQFSRQGKATGDKEQLLSYYNHTIKPNIEYLTGYNLTSLVKEGKVITKSSVELANQRISAGTGPYNVGAIQFRVSEPGKTFEKMFPLLSSGDETFIKEIESFDRNGVIKTNSKIVKREDFYKTDGTLIDTPVFMGSVNKNSQNVLMKFNGKTYEIPRKKLGSMSDETYAYDVPALNDANEQKKKLIATYGIDAYLNSREGEALENIIENSGGSYYRSMMNVLTAFSPDVSYKVNEEKKDGKNI